LLIVFISHIIILQLIPDTEVPRYSLYVALFISGAFRALICYSQTILYKGAGKNGSSIAVSAMSAFIKDLKPWAVGVLVMSFVAKYYVRMKFAVVLSLFKS